jgi:Transmembrane amino acid transporter protein
MAEGSKPVQRRFHLAIGLSTILCYILYLLTGCFGYAAFGSNTQGDILNNLPSGDTFADVAKIAMAIHVALVLPVIILPAKRCFELMATAMGTLADYHQNLYRSEESDSTPTLQLRESRPSGFIAMLFGCWSWTTGCFSSAMRRCLGQKRANAASAMCGAFLFAGCGCCPCYRARLRKVRGPETADGRRRKRHRTDLVRPATSSDATSAVSLATLQSVATTGVAAAIGGETSSETTKLLSPSTSGQIAPPPGILPLSPASAMGSPGDGVAVTPQTPYGNDDDNDSDSDEEEDLLEGPALDLQELNQRLDAYDRDPNKTFCGFRMRPYLALLLWNAFYLFACATAAILFPKVQVLFGLMGSTISVLQIFVAPAMMLLFTAWRTEEAKRRYPHLFAPSGLLTSSSFAHLSRETSNASAGTAANNAFQREYRLHHHTDSAMSLIRDHRDASTPNSSSETASRAGDSAYYLSMPTPEQSISNVGTAAATSDAAAPSSLSSSGRYHSRQPSSSKLEPLMMSSLSADEEDGDNSGNSRPKKQREKSATNFLAAAGRSASSLRLGLIGGADGAVQSNHHHVPSMATTTAPLSPSAAAVDIDNGAGQGFLESSDRQPWYTPKSVWAMKFHAYALLTVAAVLCVIGTTVNVREIIKNGGG